MSVCNGEVCQDFGINLMFNTLHTIMHQYFSLAIPIVFDVLNVNSKFPFELTFNTLNAIGNVKLRFDALWNVMC